MAYEQDNFDKRFIEVIDLLLYTNDKHRLAENQKILLTKIGFRPESFSMVRKGDRGIPKQKREAYLKKLAEDFNINPEFVRDGKLPRTFFANDLLNEDETVYKTAQQEVIELRAKVVELLEVVKMKDGIIADLKYLLDKKRSTDE